MIQASLWKKNRIPTDAELEQIQELLKQLQTNSDEPPPTKEEISGRILSATETKNTALLILRDPDKDNKIIGIGTIHRWCTLVEGYKAWVDDIVVLDGEYRGQGLGEKITTTLIAITQDTELAKIRLTSNKQNPERAAAIHLYKKLGFRESKTTLWELAITKD